MARRTHDHGSVLMLMPAAVLIVMLLAAIAVDSTIVFLAQRELADAAGAAANDAVTYAADQAGFRDSGGYALVDARLQESCASASAVRRSPVLDRARITCVFDGTGVRVTLTSTVDRLFVGAVSGTAAPVAVQATAWAQARLRTT